MTDVALGDTAAPATAGSSTATASPAVTPDASTSAAPAIQATDAPITDTTGEPPKERWADILTNARTKEREAALTEWRQQYGWAESVNRDQLSQMAEWYGRYQGDPGEFLEKAYQEALSHPVHGATVKSRIGKMLASMRAAQVPDPDIEPDIPVMDANNQVVNRTYSADMIKQLIQREARALMGNELKPLREDFESRQVKAQQQAQQDHISKESTRIKRDVLKLKDAEKHWPAINTKAVQLAAADQSLTPGEAYRDAYYAVVFPTLGPAAQAEVMSDNQKKAMAQTVTPGMPTGTAKPKFKTFEDAATYYEAHPDEAAIAARR